MPLAKRFSVKYHMLNDQYVNYALEAQVPPIEIVDTPGFQWDQIFIEIYKFFLTFNEPGGAAQQGSSFLYYLKFLSTFFCLFLICAIVYVVYQSYLVKKKDEEKYKLVTVEEVEREEKNQRWSQALTHSESENPNDWRLAILEADIMLDDMLSQKGYAEGTLGEKLTAADPLSVVKLQSAWEAHKVRNVIAHQGTEFQLSRREVRRVMGLYKEVFEANLYI